LRCAFSHDYSIFNINTYQQSKTHHFKVLGDGYDQNQLVGLPQKQWNGIHSEKTLENQTEINLPLLGDLVESIYGKLIAYHKNEELIIELKGGAEELRTKYLLFSFSG
jgi:hypothetical protein